MKKNAISTANINKKTLCDSDYIERKEKIVKKIVDLGIRKNM